MVDVNGNVEIADFSIPPNIKFRVNDDVFEAYPEIPLPLVQKAAALSQASKNTEDLLDRVTAVFVGNASEFGLLVPTAGERFRHRVYEDRVQPIGVTTVMKILPWLLEQYGLRPTAPSAVSSATSDGPASGTSLTDGAPSAE